MYKVSEREERWRGEMKRDGDKEDEEEKQKCGDRGGLY